MRRKEVRENPNLVANGRFKVWWSLECSMLSGLWEKKEKHHFHLFSFSTPNKFYINFFSLILRFYFTMVLDRYFMSFLPFPWPINCNHAFQCTNSSTHSLLNWFWSKFFSFPWIRGITHDHVLKTSSRTNEWRITSRVIPRFDIDPTPSWWKSWTARGAPSFWS
jgi:hypothetical protein